MTQNLVGEIFGVEGIVHGGFRGGCPDEVRVTLEVFVEEGAVRPVLEETRSPRHGGLDNFVTWSG